MATGPEHYREAERLLGVAAKRTNDDRGWVQAPERRAELAAEAQVHATLALAAATALNDAEAGMQGPEWTAWLDAAGEPRKATPDPVPQP